MCGIAGTYNWGDEQTIGRMTAIQAHRGPDDAGLWHHRLQDGTFLGLGARRLAIQDLSPAGHMPMANDAGTLWITYNGEVYNFPELRTELESQGHVFRSRGDTEVVLRLYEQHGPDCLTRLNGMFAFAIVDLRGSAPRLFLARDPFGIKPLYYTDRGGRLAFASEVKALLELPDLQPEMDLHALQQYLTFLWVPEPRTLFRGIRKLPAGHYGIYAQGELKLVQYWDPSFPPAGAEYPASENELSEGVRERLAGAVKSQMVSDVPLGAFLSAGLDSSSLVAMMRRATSGPVRTYTITFPRRSRVGEMLDDPAVAARVARKFDCDHHEIVVEPQVADLLPRLVWHMDEPVADPALITAYLVAHEARRTVPVLLSGIGGDEIFAGYRKYVAAQWGDTYRKIPRPLRRTGEAALLRLPTLRGTRAHSAVRLAKKMARSGSAEGLDAFLMNCTYLGQEAIAELCTPALLQEMAGEHPWQAHRDYALAAAGFAPLNQLLYLDAKTFMPSLNLLYNDKMSMASSVETRVPFLDLPLVEFVARQVPPAMKLAGRVRYTTKYILRKAMRGILPEEVFRQPKAGFGAPVGHWLADDLRGMIDDLLDAAVIRRRGLFQPAAARRMVEEQRSGRRDWSMQVWQLLTLELWMRAFLDGRQARAD